MSDIDKDIEYLKGYKYDNEVKQAIENVLKELETYKKIAEKLAEKLVEIEDGCKHIPTEICNKYSNGRCKQCIIDWARNEVENEP